MMNEKDKVFDRIFDELIEIEGGYVNDPDDPGGETKYGISKRAYPEVDIKTLDQHGAMEIYYEDYWKRTRINELASDMVARKMFLGAVNIGPDMMVMFLQQVLNDLFGYDLRPDGVLGAITLSAANSREVINHEEWLAGGLTAKLWTYYEELGNARFRRGWLRRAVM